ncbi:hypothetical protein [Nocardia sp. NPDC049149]|uniref:hypothetical protein n=1 Tax=Nocardia sp. NPDC049149 TaxID=3364315 RepID=UPI0037145BA1
MNELELRLRLRAADQYYRERMRLADEWERVKPQAYDAAAKAWGRLLLRRFRSGGTP